MKIKRRISLFLILAIVILNFSGCSKNDPNACIYFDLIDAPESLDPQTAESDSELLIVRNIYEGLLRKDQNGKIVNGACESYKKSGNTYTFTLRKGLKWSNGDALTADHFLFAFERALTPSTKAPFASRLFSVKGAKEYYEGNADKSSLGIKLKDSRTLVIELSFDDPDFKETLTTSVAMPCNRSFFKNSIGKYGLDKDYVISCGSYVLSRWNKEDFGIRLYKNEDYNGKFAAKNGSVFISAREDKTYELLNDQKVDIAFISSEDHKSLDNSEVKYRSFQNICWVLKMSEELAPDTRKALAMLVSGRDYADELQKGYSVADSFYPQVLGIDGCEGVGIRHYDLPESQKLFSDSLKGYEGKKFPQSVLYYYDVAEMKAVTTAAVGAWQQRFSAFVNIKASGSLENLIADANSGNISFAIYPITARSGSVREYISNLGMQGDKASALSLQKELLSKDIVVPIAFSTTDIAYTELITEFKSDPYNGYIDFSFIVKKK